MRLRPCWQAAAIATCIALMGCSRTPQAVPEKTVDATPAKEPVVAVMPAGEHSDPSLVDSAVTANLDANAPWTTPQTETPPATTPESDQSQQAAASPQREGAASDAPDSDSRQPSVPSGAPGPVTASPQAAARENSAVDVANSGDESRTSTN